MAGNSTTLEAQPRLADESLPAGSLVGRYVVLNRLGAGGAGVVYSAFDPDLDRKVALKLLLPHAADEGTSAAAVRQERLVLEAKSIASVSSPNVVAIFDVGAHAGKVFIAMEFLAGGTLREWLARARRSVSEIVDVFAELARGLAAAHARGVVHRDFKPDNVLFDHEGRPKVADFGLARAGGPAENPLALDGSAEAPPRLTQTGAILGTPAYMSPEQLKGKALGPGTDQFSFCVTLYEALFGRRPFVGHDLLSLATAVTAGRMEPLPAEPRVPPWLRRLLLRGLSPAPDDRFPSMAAVASELAGERRSRWRRHARAAGLAAAVLVAAALAGTLGYRRWHFEQALAAHLAEVRGSLASATRARAALDETKGKAFRLFDAHQTDEAEAAWSSALALARDVERDYARTSERIESAFLLDPSRAASRALLADVLYARADFDERHRGSPDLELRQRLAFYDEGGVRRRRLEAPARLRVEVPADLVGARATLEAFRGPPGGAGRYVVVEPAFGGPILERELAPGSYRVRVEASARLTVDFPVLLRRGEGLVLRPRLPATAPAGFVFVPASAYLIGSAADEAYRRDLQHASPLHRVEGDAFFIKRHETTYAEWIEYLEALPPAERAARTPHAASLGIQGDVELRRVDVAWELRLQPASEAYVARQGAPLRYPRRDVRREQDWLRMPVSGVSWRDALAYTAWLAHTKRVPGARLCTDSEWEHAARGADGRPFPHGWRLEPGDANYAGTWKADPTSYGPDAVGSYPASRSPFGVDDLAGNVFEWVAMPSREGGAGHGARGGAFPFDPNALRAELREMTDPTLRDVTAGVRVCADAPAE